MDTEKTEQANANLPAKLSAPPLPNSASSLTALCRILDTDIHGFLRPILVSDAMAVITAMDMHQSQCASREASHYAERLLGFYPAREVNDAKTYAAGVTALLNAYPLEFVKLVCDPVTGLPSRLKWLPTLAEIREALDAEKTRRDRILYNAKRVIAEAEKRKREAEDEARWNAQRQSPEERQKQVARLLNTNHMRQNT